MDCVFSPSQIGLAGRANESFMDWVGSVLQGKYGVGSSVIFFCKIKCIVAFSSLLSFSAPQELTCLTKVEPHPTDDNDNE